MTAVLDTLACVPSLISTTQPNGWVVDHVQCRASRENACAATICAGHDACVNACASMWKWPLWSCQIMGSSIPVPLPKGFGLPRLINILQRAPPTDRSARARSRCSTGSICRTP